MVNIDSHFADVAGLRVHYLRRGAGHPLLLLHGWPEWSHVWRPLITRLVDAFDLIAPDFRGFGDSQKTSLRPATDATPDALATDTLAVADVLGLERFGIVTHDVGSFVAQVVPRRVPHLSPQLPAALGAPERCL